MLNSFHTASKNDLESLHAILFSGANAISFEPIALLRMTTVSGELVGGNLSILNAVNGTTSDIETNGKILFLEDVHENLMSIERMFWTMRRSGKFENLAALILGDFSIPIKDNETSNSMVEEFPVPDENTIQFAFQIMISNFFAQDDFPVIFGFPAGHETGRNWSLAFGRKAEISLENKEVVIKYLVS